MHGKEGRAMAEKFLRNSSGLLVRDNRRVCEAKERILIQITLARPTGS